MLRVYERLPDRSAEISIWYRTMRSVSTRALSISQSEKRRMTLEAWLDDNELRLRRQTYRPVDKVHLTLLLVERVEGDVQLTGSQPSDPTLQRLSRYGGGDGPGVRIYPADRTSRTDLPATTAFRRRCWSLFGTCGPRSRRISPPRCRRIPDNASTLLTSKLKQQSINNCKKILLTRNRNSGVIKGGISSKTIFKIYSA